MTPMMLRFFTLVGIALAAASMQLKARAGTLPQADAPRIQALAALPAQPGERLA